MEGVWWAALLVAGGFLLTLSGTALMALLMVRVPPDYFIRRRSGQWWPDSHPLLRGVALVLKNLVGLTLVILGGVMLVTPGPGVVGLLIGLMLLDFPGKRHLIRKLVSRPRVLQTANRLRARYGREPLVVKEGART